MNFASDPRRRLLLFSVLSGAMLTGCRHHAPVTRHFLRMPAEYAGGLSSIQRAKWLKGNRRMLPGKKALTDTGHLVLPAISTFRGTVLRGMEVLHAPDAGGRGGLAVITTRGEMVGAQPQLHLLTYDHAVYVNAAPKIEFSGAPVAWRMDSGRKSITGYSSGGGPVTEVWWSGDGWRARRLP
jgi:hypothetical protein